MELMDAWGTESDRVPKIRKPIGLFICCPGALMRLIRDRTGIGRPAYVAATVVMLYSLVTASLLQAHRHHWQYD